MASFVTALSQTKNYKGYVLDSATKEPLVGATVFISREMGTITDINGLFNLKVSDSATYRVVISYTGYASRHVVLDEKYWNNYKFNLKSVDTIFLAENFITFDQVVVTAGRTDQKLTSVTVSMEVIKPYLLENRNNVSLDDAIDQVPSVSFTDGQANIRGGSGWSYGAGTRVLVMLDEMPMISGDAGQAQWSYIPVENIEQVEVIKGASSVLYGSSALNGVINIRTIRPKNRPYTAATIFTGGYDNPARSSLTWQGDRILFRHGLNAVHARKWDNFEGTFSINYLKDDGYRMSDLEERARLSFNTRYNPKGKNLYYGINGNAMVNKVGSFLLWESFDLGYTQLDSGYNITNGTRFNIDPYLVFYTGETRHSIRSRYFYLDNNVDNGDTANDQSNTSDYFYAEYQAQHYFNTVGLSLVGGVAGSYSITNSPLFQGVHATANLAPFIQVEKKWKRLTANAGARYESFRLDGYKESKPVVRAGINYKVARATFARASFGQGYRFPTIIESYVRTSAGPLQIYPNPNLKSETGWNAEIGVKQGVKIKDWLGFVDFAGFWMEFDRMMEFNFGRWGPNLGLSNLLGLGFSSINVGKTRITGIDFSTGGEGKIGQVRLNIIGGYTFMNPIALEPDAVYGQDIDGNPLTYRKNSSDSTTNMLKYRFNHMAKLDVQAGYKKWALGISFRYNSYIKTVDRFFVDPLFAAFVPGIAEARKMGEKGDYVFDLRILHQFNSFIKASVVVSNVFNRLYMTRPADLRPPRMIMVQWGFKIDK